MFHPLGLDETIKLGLDYTIYIHISTMITQMICWTASFLLSPFVLIRRPKLLQFSGHATCATKQQDAKQQNLEAPKCSSAGSPGSLCSESSFWFWVDTLYLDTWSLSETKPRPQTSKALCMCRWIFGTLSMFPAGNHLVSAEPCGAWEPSSPKRRDGPQGHHHVFLVCEQPL